jgi:hypothetical protein
MGHRRLSECGARAPYIWPPAPSTDQQTVVTLPGITQLRHNMGRLEIKNPEEARSSPFVSDAIAENAPVLPQRYADESYKLFSKVQVNDPTPEEARVIRNKCLWRILPFLCIGYHLMYVDKQTAGASLPGYSRR